MVESGTIQKYDMANMLRWVRDKKPGGYLSEPHIGQAANSFWRGNVQE